MIKKHGTNLFVKNKICEHNEYCVTYLSYIGKCEYDIKGIYKCNNNKIFCTKYNLINLTEWKKMNKVEKLQLIEDMNFKDIKEKFKN